MRVGCALLAVQFVTNLDIHPDLAIQLLLSNFGCASVFENIKVLSSLFKRVLRSHSCLFRFADEKGREQLQRRTATVDFQITLYFGYVVARYASPDLPIPCEEGLPRSAV